MTSFHLAWRTNEGPGEPQLAAQDGSPVVSPLTLHAPVRLAVQAAPGSAPLLRLSVEPAERKLTAGADPAVLHYFRLADATVQPLPPESSPLAFQPGDAYIAVTPGSARLAAPQPGGAAPAIARFLHLRDYFNAEKLATALLAHLLELSPDADPEGAGVLVVEAR